ncbi:spore coat protein [Bacillus sp. Bos-x628]|uniref:spore coat protein n=1 Tax=Bacillus maqinnsis TaxID=3229854 RepID=UPI0033902975
MFKKRKGISTGALIAGSTAIIALFSPVLRKRLKGMATMKMSPMMKGNKHNHQQHEHSQKQSHAHQETKGTAEVAQMMKQAFSSDQTNETDHQHHSSSRPNQPPRGAYAKPLHLDESVMNVMDDESIQQVINEIEHK